MSKHIVIDARIRQTSTGRPVDRLLENLQGLKSNYKYTVILSKSDTWQPKNKKFSVISSRFKQFSFNPLNQVLLSLQLYRLKPDLVHFTMTGQQPILYFGRQITMTHDLTMLKFARRGRLPKWLHALRMHAYRFLLWQSHKKASKVLVPTEYVKHAVHKYHLFTGRKLEITLEASDPPIKANSMKPEGAPEEYILYVGSAFPHKNLRRLIKSFVAVKSKNPDLRLVLTGNREYHSRKLEKWAKKRSLDDGVIFTGFVENAELKWLYENAKAYVFPSLSEGFGLPGLEAMVHGCPVVSSNATCLPEVYGEAAEYFDPNNVEEMSKTINKVLAREDLRKDLIKKGYAQSKKYSWQKMAEETLSTYQTVLSD